MYALLLARDGRVPVTTLAQRLATALDRAPNEVTRSLRQSPWILARNVSAVALDPVFEVLSDAGVTAKAVPETWMPVLPRALRLRNADVMEKGLFLLAAEPPAPPFLPWKDLGIVSGGIVTIGEEEAHHFAGLEDSGSILTATYPGLGATPGSAPLASGRRKAEDHLLVDLLFEGAGEWRLRIDGGDFNYDFLKAEMQPSSRENLRLLLMKVRERAPEALFTDRTLAFLAGDPSASYRFRSLAAFETHDLWVLQAAREEEEEEEPEQV